MGSARHTTLPKDWNNARIRAEVTSAWENRKIKGDRWEGTSKSGVRIEGYVHPRRTAYPIYEKPN
ncbi:EndoU domain-containing protein [Kingella denitrificans]|uniref:EndoU domain-containing protein n=1 Tax=Kingella denitrificans TaxID=502 RepID=UPI000B99BED0|nr:EndoU domain-containing protein [Kingella denitrificans]